MATRKDYKKADLAVLLIQAIGGLVGQVLRYGACTTGVCLALQLFGVI